MITPASTTPASTFAHGDTDHATLIGMTVPLMGGRWQRDRIVLGERIPPAMAAGIARSGNVAIDLAHAATPALRLTAPARVALAYDPDNLPDARAALIAASAQGGWPIAADPQSLALLTLAERIAASEIPVLLEGPTGTGKEVLAQFVHRLSARDTGPFVAVNCAAMPEAMLEALLFGHKKGAFTGAAEAGEGLFRAADKGTLLLDEIGELPLALQAKLLRALQEGEILPLGATRPITVDVRVVATTTRESGGAVSAYVAQGSDGAQLVLKGAEGATNGFVLEPVGAGGAAVPGDLSYLAWNPASDAGELRATAGDATFLLDTVEITSETNRVTGLPGGFNLDLTATNIGAPITLSFANDPSAISSVMSDFVAALNDIAGQLNTLAAPIGGALGGDAGARELRRDLAALASLVVAPNAAPGEPRTLGDLGVAINRDGTFQLDSARLNRSLEAAPDAVAGLFTTGATGVFAAFDRFARQATLLGDPGSLGGSVQRFERQVEQADERLARIAEQQEQLRERLTREFVASGRRVTAAQSPLDFVRANLAPRDDNN